MSKENIISEIKKCIVFIYRVGEEGKKPPIGTGFWVLVKKENSDKSKGYFVTAKHVLLDKNGNFLPEIVVRLNRLDGQLSYSKITIDSNNILTHTDTDVDIAVIIGAPREEIIEFKGIPSDLISTKQSVIDSGIREGDDVFFAGLFTSFFGVKKNHPIFRFGKVALMTDEKIPWKEKVNQPPIFVNLYLIECQTFGGSSGSPVFFNLNPMREPGVIAVGGLKISLAGIVKGSFLSASEIEKIRKPNQEKTTKEEELDEEEMLISRENIGISAITPAYQLYEILFRDDVIKLRNN